ncbi:hypothetical protein FRC17_009669 [Serendipita sp. 399]|nr:hypothetical protein FRC17_009669 [Serendipita sp. 399]
MALRSVILKNAVKLVPSHGFTRAGLAQATLNVSKGDPFPDRTLDILFGPGEEARKTLIRAWLDEGINAMGPHDGEVNMTVRDALHQRLEWNTPVIDKLPEAYALLATPSGLVPPLGIKDIVEHPAKVAHRACRVTNDRASGTSWYAQRAALATIYAAAGLCSKRRTTQFANGLLSELHQLTSPATAPRFLDGLLEANQKFSGVASDILTFGDYVGRSWLAIARSKGLLP